MFTPKAASILVNLVEWRKDQFKELFDAFHHPIVGDAMIGKVLEANDIEPFEFYKENEKIFDRKSLQGVDRSLGQVESESFDCDDFSLWCAVSMRKRYKPRVLCVAWSTGFWPWQFGGHNVCVYELAGKLGYVGNWPGRHGFGSEKGLVRDVLSRAGRGQSDLIGYKFWQREELFIKNT